MKHNCLKESLPLLIFIFYLQFFTLLKSFNLYSHHFQWLTFDHTKLLQSDIYCLEKCTHFPEYHFNSLKKTALTALCSMENLFYHCYNAFSLNCTKSRFLAALSSSRRLVVRWLVGLNTDKIIPLDNYIICIPVIFTVMFRVLNQTYQALSYSNPK